MRGKKEEKTYGLKAGLRPVYCPQCGRRILDAVGGTRTRLMAPAKGQYPDFIIKCGHCGAEVGLVKN